MEMIQWNIILSCKYMLKREIKTKKENIFSQMFCGVYQCDMIYYCVWHIFLYKNNGLGYDILIQVSSVLQ